MSLAGLVRHRGSVCDVYRPVTTPDAASGLSDVTWPGTPASGNARVLLDVIADELAQKIFGRETSLVLRGVVLPDVDVQKDDGVYVRTGAYSGRRFRVTAAVPSTVLARSQHAELALDVTAEVFG